MQPGQGRSEVSAEGWVGVGCCISFRKVAPRPEGGGDPIVTLRLACSPWCLLDQSWSGLLTYYWVCTLGTGPSSLRKGQAAATSVNSGPPWREGGLWGIWHIPLEGSWDAASTAHPWPRPGVRPSGGGGGSRRFGWVLPFVCLQRAGPPYSQVSHTLKRRLSSCQGWVR